MRRCRRGRSDAHRASEHVAASTRADFGAAQIHKIVRRAADCARRRHGGVSATRSTGDATLGPVLERRLKQGWRTKYRPGYEPIVVNLAELGAGAASYITTLRRYEDLAPDVVCIYDGYAPPAGGSAMDAMSRWSFAGSGICRFWPTSSAAARRGPPRRPASIRFSTPAPAPIRRASRDRPSTAPR